MSDVARHAKWRRKRRKELIESFGGQCRAELHGLPPCDSRQQLEFAHTAPTPVVGRGRGSHHRILDVQRSRDSYTLLCHHCHR